MKYNLPQLFIFITVICLILGSYSLGVNKGRYLGYHEAKDHYDVILQANAKYPQNWYDIGELLRKGRVGMVKDDPMDTMTEAGEYKSQISGIRWTEICEVGE